MSNPIFLEKYQQRILCLLPELALAVLRESRLALQASGLPWAHLANIKNPAPTLKIFARLMAKILQ